MLKTRTGWTGLILLVLSVLLFGPRAAQAEASWTENFEIYLDGSAINVPWASVSAYADGQYMQAHGGLISAHLGDNTGGYADMTSHWLKRPVNVTYSGTTITFWATYVMADNADYAVFEYSTDGGYTWTTLWGPVNATAIMPWTQYGPFNLPVGTNYIRFRFESDNSGNVNPGGFWVDDVSFNNPGFPLTVVSDWGDPQPPAGINMIPESANNITCSVTTPYNHPLEEGVRFICTGWLGDGTVVPASGTGSSVDVVVNAEGWIQWQWKRQFGVQAISQDGVGSPGTEGWFWFDENTQATVTGTKYVESALPGWGWRCSGFVGTGSAPANGSFLAEDDIVVTFTINEYSTITWIWADQYKLTVVNPGGWGNPNPAGEVWFDVDANVSAAIDDLYMEGETIRHTLTGYELQIGSSPPVTGTDRVVNFQITAPATLTWFWRTDYLLDVRNPQFIGTINPDIGTYWMEENTVTTCSAISPASDGVNTWLAIGYNLNGQITYFNDYNNPQVSFQMTGPAIFTWMWELETLPFEVISEFGEPNPPVGVHYYPFNATITASVYSPYYPPDEPGVMHVCTGFTGTGSVVPAQSSQLSVSFQLRTQGTTITWNWYTQYKLIVLSTIPDVVTTPEMRQGGYWYPAGTEIDASVEAYIPGYRCTGYLMTMGEAQSSGDTTFVTFTIEGPTTITWNWEEEEVLTRLPSWNDPLLVSAVDPSVGMFPSLKRDPVNGRPSVAYYKVDGSEAGSLYYSYWDGVQWHTEFVDGNAPEESKAALVNVGLYASLALDSMGRPHIAYYDAANGALKYAIRNVTGGWNVVTVDSGGPANNDVGSYCSLVLNPLNEPRISYYDATSKNLKYAALEYGVWSTEVVDTEGEVGSNTAIALDPVTGLPRIAYRDDGNRSLKFAWLEDNRWFSMTIDSSDDTGYTPSMVIDGRGNAHLAYQLFNGTTSALIYAVQSGKKFYPKTVAAGTGPDTGFVPSLALDDGGHPYIAYNDASTHSLVFSLYNGERWLSDVLDTNAVGAYVSLTLYKNVPSVAYWSFNGLRYVEAKSDSTTGGNPIPGLNEPGTRGDGGGGGCFVATSAFGSYSAGIVEELCTVRDAALSASLGGDALVGLYYAVSPGVAARMSESVRAIVRSLLGGAVR